MEYFRQSKIGDIFFFSFLLLSLFFGYLIFEPFIKIIIISILITVILYPLKEKLNRYIKNEILVSLICTVIVFIFIIVPSLILILFITNQTLYLYPKFISLVSQENLIEYIIQNLPFSEKLTSYIGKIDTSLTIQLEEVIKSYAHTIFEFILEQSKTILLNIAFVLVGIFLMLLLIFFLFKDGKNFYNRIYKLIPLSDKDKNFIVYKTYQAIQGVVLGSVLTAIAQAILGFIAYFFAGIEFSIFWAFLTFIASFIPIGGASLVWVPLAIYIFLTGSLINGVIFTIWGVAVISMVDNFIKPWVIGDKTNIHPIVLFFAILGGLNLFGFLGIFLAPIIVVLIDNLLKLYQERYHISE
ncbi:MAG: AI-2E family transporter [Persephonella sp.]|nr:MAG: AI-2E family transporter [Persephonella sp.]